MCLFCLYYRIKMIAFTSSFFNNQREKTNKNKNFDSGLPWTRKYCKQTIQGRINDYTSCKPSG